MCTEEKVKCPRCGEEWDYIDLWNWPAISIEDDTIIITDFFCKKCNCILWGYTKVEWKYKNKSNLF